MKFKARDKKKHSEVEKRSLSFGTKKIPLVSL